MRRWARPTRLGLALLLSLGACGTTEGREPPPSAAKPDPAPTLEGTWRATLTSPGGELPFELHVHDREGTLQATAHNGTETVEFTSVSLGGDTAVLRIDGYDSEVRATLKDDGQSLWGVWTKTTPDGPSSMPFAATRGAQPRFSSETPAPSYDVPKSVDGEWSVRFREEDDSTFVGHAILTSSDGALHGTILTDTGDYRYLEGRYANGTVELSCFDGGHAFLFRATVAEDGSLEGNFWSRASYHATWTATPMSPGQASPLADPFTAVTLSSRETEGRFRFAFPDSSGATVTDEDPRFRDKVVLIDIFGTWCPNCNDYAPVLARWHDTYGPRGLEIVGLAFEFTGDVKRDRAQLATYAQTHGITFPLLLAGTSDKGDAAELLPSIDEVKSYPTTILVGRDGRVHKIHSGFAGPATGKHHERLLNTLQTEIESLL
ncbi:MAG: TlpA family protein disulfide reductase [Nannocystales bacterium]